MRCYLVLVPLAFATACTAAPPDTVSTAQAARECFFASSVTGFSDAGPDKAIVNIGSRESWELTLSGGCPDVDYAMKIGIVSRGSQRICSGRHAELIVPSASGSGAKRCLVRSVRKLSSAEADAVRGRSPTS